MWVKVNSFTDKTAKIAERIIHSVWMLDLKLHLFARKLQFLQYKSFRVISIFVLVVTGSCQKANDKRGNSIMIVMSALRLLLVKESGKKGNPANYTTCSVLRQCCFTKWRWKWDDKAKVKSALSDSGWMNLKVSEILSHLMIHCLLLGF